MIAKDAMRLVVRVYDTANELGRKRMDQAASADDYAAAQKAANDALGEMADVIYSHFPLTEDAEVTP